MEKHKNNWKLVRENDGLKKHSQEIKWLTHDEDGYLKEKHETADVGRSLIMSPFSLHFTWLTTAVTEIVKQTEDYVKFHTKNSTYELFKLTENHPDENTKEENQNLTL